ncbi:MULTISPECIES: GTPase [Campylobacter]|uniref:GTPase n=1 Tax=Campylobacter TaxID=194 RepID=UPI001282D0A7|nr:GTPase [Campylobacter lari]MBT0815252.1 50S ribosome-binding GTPase [Campylobacter lari]MCR8676938.1 50S ribosome-binding GTPase [Campylobacter sp. S4:11]
MSSDDILNKFDIRNEYESFLTILETISKKPTICVIGLYNSGKSSLLNALTNSFDKNNFSVADIVKTKEIKSLEYEDVIFTDTPGLNVDEDDDANASKGFLQSDIYLFVHSVLTGELHKQEFEYLKKLVENNDDNFVKNLVIILSKSDGVDRDKIKQVKESVKNQLLNFIDQKTIDKMKIIPISSESYIKGYNENKKLLIENSNIELLNQTLNDLKSNLKADGNRKNKLLNHEIFSKINELISQKNKELKEKTTKRKQLKTKIDKDIKEANEDLAKFFNKEI